MPVVEEVIEKQVIVEMISARKLSNDAEKAIVFTIETLANSLRKQAKLDIEKYQRKELADGFERLEDQGLEVVQVRCNATTYSSVSWASTGFDPTTRSELMKQGYLGNLWGAKIQLDNSVPTGKFELIGRTPQKESEEKENGK